MKLLGHVQLFATPWTVPHQAPPSMGFSRQEYWSGLPFPSPGDLPNPGTEPGSPALQADILSSEPPKKSNMEEVVFQQWMKERQKFWVSGGGTPKRFGSISDEVEWGWLFTQTNIGPQVGQITQFKVNLHFFRSGTCLILCTPDSWRTSLVLNDRCYIFINIWHLFISRQCCFSV